MQRLVRSLVPLAALVTVLGLALVHATLIGHYPYFRGTTFPWTVALAVLLALGAYAAGVPDVPRTLTGAFGASVAALVAGVAVVSVAQLVLAVPLLPRFVLFGSIAVLLPTFVVSTVVSERVRRWQEGSDLVVLVANPEEADALAAELGRAPERPARLVATLSPQEAARRPDGGEPLVAAAAAGRASVVVLDRRAQADDTVVAQAAALHGRGLRVRTLSLFYDEWLGKLPVGELERMSLMFDIQEVHARRYARLKRFFDLAVAGAALVPLALAVPLVALVDLAGNRGPLFYRQARVGKDGRQLTIVKFRTMAPGVGDTEWTQRDDPRLRAVGRWLRRTHLDELPQALNILAGDLSVVGPRPEQPHYVAELRQKIPFYDVRHLVHPGLTGWAQVKFDYGASVADAIEKLQYEFYYLRHQGLALDARIIVRTLRSLVHRPGR